MATKRTVHPIAQFKAAPSGAAGEFTALVSVFGNVDLVGDRVMPGAFKGSIARWQATGDPIPVIWSHAWDDPFAHIGYVTSAVETAAGLQITGKNDLDKPFAAQVHDLMLSRRVTGMSFAYDVLDERRASDGANELVELDLIEVGPTLKGANPEAQLVAAKALLRAERQPGVFAQLEAIVAGGTKAAPDALQDLAREVRIIQAERDEIAADVDSWLASKSSDDTSGEVAHVRLLGGVAKAAFSAALDALNGPVARKAAPSAEVLLVALSELVDATKHSRSALAVMGAHQLKAVDESAQMRRRIDELRSGVAAARAYNVDDPASVRDHIAALRTGSSA